MDSPLTAPILIENASDDVFDEIPTIERRRTRSFDCIESADTLDLTYSYSADVSPIASIAFVPRNLTGAPNLPRSPQLAARRFAQEGFARNVSSKESPLNRRPEEEVNRHLDVADYDLSEEEDDLLNFIDDECETISDAPPSADNQVDTSCDTAPVVQSEPLGDGAHFRARSSSFSDISPLLSKPIQQTAEEDIDNLSLSDLAVPSLSTTVAMRRVASTPIRSLERRQSISSMPPLSQNDVSSPAKARRRDSSPNLPVPPPFALRRQVSMPVKNTMPTRSSPYKLRRISSLERVSPKLQFTDDPKKSTIDDERVNRGASIFRSGRIGALASPGGVRTPSPRRASRQSPERLTLSAPYPFRPASTPITSVGERRSSDILFCDDSSRSSLRVEFRPSENNQRSRDYAKESKRNDESPRRRHHRRGSIVIEEWPDIKENPTGYTDGVSDEDNDLEQGLNTKEDIQQPLNNDDRLGSLGSDSSRIKDEKIFFKRQTTRYVLYLSAFSIFGCTIRVFLVRIFGLACEVSDHEMDEFCITATGTTMQRGGALFADLPANMFGCFVMGLVTSLQPDLWPPLPWLSPDHPLQQHDAYHVGIRSGLCGCITTFASWNAQMVVMMDGTATELGSQIVAGLFGYVIGFFCAVMSFLFGTHASVWLTRWRNPHLAREDDEEARLNSTRGMEHDLEYIERGPVQPSQQHPPRSVVVVPALFSMGRVCQDRWICNGMLPFLLVAFLLFAYAVGGFLFDNAFSRTMLYSSFVTPPGALLRWELSKLNTRFNDSRWRRLRWLPIGTFVSNILGCLVSILLLALQTRYLTDDRNKNLWAISLVAALRDGFAGSLSTVSTMVKEMFELQDEFPHHAKAYRYACLTVVVAILSSVMIYSPIVKSG